MRDATKHRGESQPAWPDAEFVQEVLAQWPWYHQIALLDKLSAAEDRCWNVDQAIEHHRSRNVAVMQIETYASARSGQTITNLERRLPALYSDLARDSLEDPYRFDFLCLTETAQECEVESALVLLRYCRGSPGPR